METWNNKKTFSEVLVRNKKLNSLLSKKEIEIITKDSNKLKNIDWIYKNKIK